MKNFKSILIFDVFWGQTFSDVFLRAIPGKLLSSKIAFQQTVDYVYSKVWQNDWKVDLVTDRNAHAREIYKYAPADIHLENSAKIIGCVMILELGLYSHLLQSIGKEMIHKDMASDGFNSIKWARRYGIATATVVLEDRKQLTEEYSQQIKSIYDLSSEDLFLRANSTQRNTVLTVLDTIKQHFERT